MFFPKIFEIVSHLVLHMRIYSFVLHISINNLQILLHFLFISLKIIKKRTYFIKQISIHSTADHYTYNWKYHFIVSLWKDVPIPNSYHCYNRKVISSDIFYFPFSLWYFLKIHPSFLIIFGLNISYENPQTCENVRDNHYCE